MGLGGFSFCVVFLMYLFRFGGFGSCGVVFQMGVGRLGIFRGVGSGRGILVLGGFVLSRCSISLGRHVLRGRGQAKLSLRDGVS